MFNKKRALTAAVLLSCSFFMAPYYAHAAEEEEPSCGHPSYYMQVTADSLTYQFDLYDATNHYGPHWRGEYTTNDDGQKVKEYASYRDLFTGEKQAFGDSIAYMHNIINTSDAFPPTIKLELLPEKDANAAAQSETYITFNNDGTPVQISDTELAAVLQGKYHPEDNDIVAEIEVDLAPPNVNWYIEKFPSLPSNGTDSDYYGTITHEMFHALGLGTYISNDSSGKVTFGTSGNYDDNGYKRSMAVFNKYEMGIRDVFGRVTYYAVSSETESELKTYTYFDENPIDPNASDALSDIEGELVSRDIIPITLEQFNDPNFVKKDDEFYILKGDDVETNSGTYFTGENVEKVLTTYNAKTGENELASIPWPDGSEVQPVRGLPLNGYEGDETTPELSHIELQNCNMSHQSYRNWCNFMEAELAILQDLGYNVDRGAYYGKSIYNSYIEYVNEQGFYNRIQDEDGNWYYGTGPNTTMHGTGLHIYGSNNSVTQKGTILADGYAANGVRVDGVGNKLTIDSDITANGDYGNGLLVAYGKEHEITLNAGKSIEATGADGVAARFDFGSNELGDQSGYRGSYINTSYTSQEEIDEREAERPGSSAGMQVGWSEFIEDDIPDDIQGALVENFNVAGNLVGGKAAIYISPNAYVKNINIAKGAVIEGNIISEWNPNEIIYQNEDTEATIAPLLPEDDNGLTNLNFNANLSYDYNILGKESIIANVQSNKLSLNGTVAVREFNVATDSTLCGNGTINVYDYEDTNNAYGFGTGTFTNNGTVAPGNSIGTLTINGNYNQSSTGNLLIEFTKSDNDKLIVNGQASLNGTLTLKPLADYYDTPVTIDAVQATGIVNNYTLNIDSPTLLLDADTSDADTAQYVITRANNALSQYGYDAVTKQLAAILDANFTSANDEWQKLYSALDTTSGDGSGVRNALKQLNPNVVGSSAQATLSTHNLLNTMNMLGGFSNNVPAARMGGGRGPATDAAPKYNSWRNIVMPFSAYTDQHNGNNGYTNHNSGVIGAMERTLENGLTHGYHAALNHQSTSDSGSTIKGEGLYLGAQASYAPADWNGWSLFGSARLGVEQMRSHRNVSIGGYTGKADADWTGYSGSLNVGTALTKEHGVLQSGPFAALDYSFAHRPSVHEDGGGIRTELASATYDSLRTQFGYRLSTKPKALDNYDSTKWQAHASVAWNHELLSDNGRTSYQLSDFPGSTIEDTIETYGRDSMSIAAGITFKTPKRLDVGLTLGSDIYRKGGSSVYGKVNFEWKF